MKGQVKQQLLRGVIKVGLVGHGHRTHTHRMNHFHPVKYLGFQRSINNASNGHVCLFLFLNNSSPIEKVESNRCDELKEETI